MIYVISFLIHDFLCEIEFVQKFEGFAKSGHRCHRAASSFAIKREVPQE